MLTVLVLEDVLEKVQIVMTALAILCNWYKEAHEEDDNDQGNECNCILESAPES